MFHKDIFKTIGCARGGSGKFYMKESPGLLRKLEQFRENIKGKE